MPEWLQWFGLGLSVADAIAALVLWRRIVRVERQARSGNQKLAEILIERQKCPH